KGETGGRRNAMIQETMTRQERFEAAVALERPDRVPVTPLIAGFALRCQGLTQGQGWRDGEVGFKAMIDTFNDLGGYDKLFKTNLFWPMIGGRFCGAPVRSLIPGKQLPEDALNQIDERELFSREDYDKIAAVGWNAFWDEHFEIMSRGRSIEHLKITQDRLLKEYNREVEICHGMGIPPLLGCYVDSVFMAFSMCRTLTQFTMDLYEVPEKIKAAMDASCDDLIQNALDVISRTRIPLAFIVLERGSGFYYRLDIFEQFEWPYLQRYVDAFVSEGITPWLHFDTDWSLNLPHLKQLPKGKCVADLDSTTDIFKAKEILNGHMCISGDIPASLLSLGTPEQVREYCERLIDEVGRGGGFFLTTGCDCPVDAKFDNVKMMIDTAKTYKGRF
ncbi:MAG: uroporphyrinogen decarboxylase family protein, partial [Pseudomonadota bacterium]